MGRVVCGSRAGRIGFRSVLAICAIVVMAAWFISPAFLRVRKCGGPPDCQSNLHQIGSAFKMYLGEWHDAYPTQRVLLRNGSPGPVVAHVKLTLPGEANSDGTPKRYQYGISWVEALFPYVERITKTSSGAWACHAVGKEKYPEDSDTAGVTYAFNRNLVEVTEDAVRFAENTMMVREMDRRVDAELRPTNYSCGRPDVPPDSPFLTKHDSWIGRTNPLLHNMGSNVLFADGHVKNLYGFGNPEYLTAKQCWCAKAKIRISVPGADRYTYVDQVREKVLRITP